MIEKWKDAVEKKSLWSFSHTFIESIRLYMSWFINLKIKCLWPITSRTLNLVQNYLQNCKHRTKNCTSYSLWEEIFSGVLQGSIMGPLLFNIFLYDLFWTIESNYFAIYADDTTPYVTGKKAKGIVSKIKAITQK